MNLTRQLSVSSLTNEQIDIETIKFNYYKELRPRLHTYTSSLYEYLVNQSTSLLQTQFAMIMLLVAQALVSVIFLFYFVWIKKRILRKKQEILFLFLDIPRSEVQGIFKKCDNFINFFTVYYR